MKTLLRLLLAALLALSATTAFGSQSTTSIFLPDADRFTLYTFQIPGDHPQKTTLELQPAFQHAVLQFHYGAEAGPIARYTLSIDIFDTAGDHVFGDISSGTLTPVSGVSPPGLAPGITVKSVASLKPGAYRIHLELLDHETGRVHTRWRVLEVSRFPETNLGVSTLRIRQNSLGVDGSVESPSALFPVMKAPFVVRHALAGFASGEAVYCEYELQDRAGSVLASWAETWRIGARSQLLTSRLPVSPEEPGAYAVALRVRRGSESVSVTAPFRIVGWGETERDATLAGSFDDLLPMVQVMEHDAFHAMMTGPRADRRSIVSEYWRLRDPSPETERNELLEEFIYRVRYANQYFSETASQDLGWSTDRGTVLIRYGQPEFVRTGKSRRFGRGELEIWYYPSHAKRFVFQRSLKKQTYHLVEQAAMGYDAAIHGSSPSSD